MGGKIISAIVEVSCNEKLLASVASKTATVQVPRISLRDIISEFAQAGSSQSTRVSLLLGVDIHGLFRVPQVEMMSRIRQRLPSCGRSTGPTRY